MAAIKGVVPKWKLESVNEIRDLIKTYPVLAIVGFRGVTATQMQKIRRFVRQFGILKVVKNSLLEKAFDSIGGEYVKLKDFIEDQTAIVLTDMNPFKLFKKLEETKEQSFLKPNQISPVDIVLQPGPTNIPPGPHMAELQAAGIPLSIDKGKVLIKSQVTLVKAGEIVKPEVARALEKLEIRPIKIGLEVRAVYDGVILTPDYLQIDQEKTVSELQKAYTNALNLAVNTCYITRETASLILMKALTNAKNLAISAGIFERDVMPEIILKAYKEMLALASLLPKEALDDELKVVLGKITVEEERKEEKKEEKVKEEEKKEEKKEDEAVEGLSLLFG
ncbi:MAG: 50S ribosomal protein L10 [Archaeoglobaceae archaeon]|nr:50S ribosomal protein L10 [Archaeoglobaceae archaeon]MCX8152181.1 50S ribosomal protein L10 [Archaeoglobaceae archaeon]MDW8013897.1 50S ribosomal protein L10 [Archaeoglobaceae archaeon]